MQAMAGYGPGGYGQAVMDWDSRAYANNNTGQYGGQPAFGAAGYGAGGGAQPQGWASSNRSGGSSGAVSNASFRRRM